jgi:hypothetical protein
MCLYTSIKLMSNMKLSENGDHSILDIEISKPGRLGIEFRATEPPYFVINVSNEAQELYGVQPGDLLMTVKKGADVEWTNAENLDWPGLVEILRQRPANAKFKRFNIKARDRVSGVSTSESERDSVEIILPAPQVSLPPILESVAEPQPARLFHSPIVRGDASPKPGVQPIKTPFAQISVSPRAESLGSASPPTINPPPASPASVVPPFSPASAGSVSTPTGRRNSTSDSSNLLTIVYSAEGPLGLEFDEMEYPFRVGVVRTGSMSAEKGVRKGDSLHSVNGKETKRMRWDDIRAELSSRPATVVFFRDPTLPTQSHSIWDVAAGLMKGSSTPDPLEEIKRERDELKEIVTAVGAEDLVVLKQKAIEYESLKTKVIQMEGQVDNFRKERDSATTRAEEERTKNLKLVEVIDEIEKSQSAVIDRFEKEIHEKERVISELRGQRSRAGSAALSSAEMLSKVESLQESLKEKEAKLELMEKDNTRLRQENKELGGMVQSCLEKIQRDLSDKPHWVDRRVVCTAIGTLLRDMDQIDDSQSAAIDKHTSARQKLGDVLGMTYEERSGIGLLTAPARLSQYQGDRSPDRGKSITEDFVTFLEREATTSPTLDP